MARVGLVTTDDLSGLLGYTLSGTELTRATSVIQIASEVVRYAANQTYLNTDGTLGTVPDEIEAITLQVSYRAFTNPEALMQKSLPDFQRGYDRAEVGGGAAFYLTDIEEDQIRALTGTDFVEVRMENPFYLSDLESSNDESS